MADPTVSLAISESPPLRPGAEVSGVVRVEGGTPGASVLVRARWRADCAGAHTEVRVPLEGRGGELPFTLRLPLGPPSHEGSLVTVTWVLSATLDGAGRWTEQPLDVASPPQVLHEYRGGLGGAAVSETVYGNTPKKLIAAGLFMIPFGSLGILVVLDGGWLFGLCWMLISVLGVVALKQGVELALSNRRVEGVDVLDLDHGDGELRGRVLVHGRGPVEALTATLHVREVSIVEDEEGRSRTRRAPLHAAPLAFEALEVVDEETVAARFRCALPDGLPGPFYLEDHALAWTVEVDVALERWPDKKTALLIASEAA